MAQVETAKKPANDYAASAAFNAQRDLLFAEAGRQLAGFAGLEFARDVAREARYMHNAFIHPDRRGQGLAAQMLAHNECVLREIAAAHPPSPIRLPHSPFLGRRGTNALVRRAYAA
jgi:GNAT superfamily N-acetyltransferase